MPTHTHTHPPRASARMRARDGEEPRVVVEYPLDRIRQLRAEGEGLPRGALLADRRHEPLDKGMLGRPLDVVALVAAAAAVPILGIV